jgi:hypothetical protein
VHIVGVALVAAERKLPEAETAKVLRGRLQTWKLVRFSEKHRINGDWLFCGDLKGLLDTVPGCPSRPQDPGS